MTKVQFVTLQLSLSLFLWSQIYCQHSLLISPFKTDPEMLVFV